MVSALVLGLVLGQPPQDLRLQPGIGITRSGKVAASKYVLPPGERGAVVIERDGITVDFGGAEIRSPSPDQGSYEGTGLLLQNRRNVTIRNARISGYRYNIRLLNCQNIRLENCIVDRSRAIRMATPEGQPIDHFVNIRNINVWRTYGAGIWMENSSGSRVAGCRGTGAQNGILLVGSNENTIERSDFSFNSGWGIGLAQSDRNDVVWNHADFVNRPWAGDWGGDAAGVAVVDGSDENYFVGNSFTHGGDGFFLTDRTNGGFDRATGTFKFEGSSNNNVVAYNDGSWSPANAFEGTFSFGNVYLNNLANDANYGFWLGYSSDSLIARNDIFGSRQDGVAIEQGSNNVIELNDIRSTGRSAVHLWSGTAPEHKTRPSANNRIVGNEIRTAASAYSLENSTGTVVADNVIEQAKVPDTAVLTEPSTLATRAFLASAKYQKVQRLMAARPEGFRLYRELGMPLGLKWVQPAEFAPRDFRNDLLAHRKVNESELEIAPVQGLLPKVNHSPQVEMVPGLGASGTWFIRPILAPGAVGGFVDPKIVASRGLATQSISALLFAADWNVRWFNWEKDQLKLDDAAGWNALFASTPVVERSQRQIAGDFSFKSQAPGIRTEYFAFEATTKVRLDAGMYEFSALSDDGLQVFFDGKPVIDAWRQTPGNVAGKVQAAAGVHEIRVRFMQTFGHTYLRLSLSKATN